VGEELLLSSEWVGKICQQFGKMVKKERVADIHVNWSTEDSQESTLNSMVASKEIIILMTRDYLKSELCRMNFYLAMQATSMDRFKQMIVIIYPDVGNILDFGKEMKSFLEMCTCIERDTFMFWNKLLFTLPHQTKHDDDNLKEVVVNVEDNTV